MEMQRMFVSESELEEKRRKKQEEWEKVRTADQPLEAPEEEVDNRSLFERLQEQKTKKQEEWDESRKLKNLVRGIDNDESDFLGTVDELKEKLDREKRLEEERELKEFHERRAKQMEEDSDRLRAETASTAGAAAKSSGQSTSTSKKNLQQKLILKGVKRKLPSDQGKPEENGAEASPPKVQVCRVMLPGMDCYEGSSTDDSDSEDDEPRLAGNYDLLGRRTRVGDGKKKKA